MSGIGHGKNKSPLVALLLPLQRPPRPIDDAFCFPGRNNQFHGRMGMRMEMNAVGGLLPFLYIAIAVQEIRR